jgi:hypothetical protein
MLAVLCKIRQGLLALVAVLLIGGELREYQKQDDMFKRERPLPPRIVRGYLAQRQQRQPRIEDGD